MTIANVSPKSSSLARPMLVSAVTAAVVCGAVLLGAHYAQALLGGPVESAFAFSGTLTGTTGAQTLTFTFQRGTLSCMVPVSGVLPDATTGAFQVSIPTTDCPASVLDDPASTVSVAVGTTVVIAARPIEPVPFARYAERLGTGLCPTGYDVDPSVSAPRHGCTRNGDVVVRVGDGSSAFWIDRYEASVWSGVDGTGTRYGASADDYPATFPDNGQWAGVAPTAYAASVAGVLPSVNITWFQAAAACRASGKRLPTGEEWLAAARATPDGAGCNVSTTGARVTGSGASCESASGAQDMIGNVWERTSEWYASANGATDFLTVTAWPADYAMDATLGVTSYAYQSSLTRSQGTPAGALRGGAWATGTAAGVFTFDVTSSPSRSLPSMGFRCVVER